MKRSLWLSLCLLLLPAILCACTQQTEPSETPVTIAEASSPTPLPEPVRLPAADCFAPGEDGLACPGSPVHAGEAAGILSAFLEAGPDALSGRGETLAAALGTGDAVLTEEDWCGLLEDLFSGPCGIEPEDAPLTRLRAAAALSAYLEPGDGRDARYYPDLPETEASRPLLLLLSEGPWDRADVIARTEMGTYFSGGVLYRTDENGYFLPDSQLGPLTFDHTGRYTSGNAELDALVEAKLAEITSPEMTRLEMLRAAYDETRDTIVYEARRNFQYTHESAEGPEGWGIPTALETLQTNTGNCYCFAAKFAYLARGLGFEAYARGGYMTPAEGDWDWTNHGWCDLLLDGERYLCDPVLEWEHWNYHWEEMDMFLQGERIRAGLGYTTLPDEVPEPYQWPIGGDTEEEGSMEP